MAHEPRQNRTRPARFAVYGVVIGLIAGVLLGVWGSRQDWLVPELRGTGARLNVRSVRRSDPLLAFNLDGLLVPATEIVHGGPPKDGIPALLDPSTVPLAAADFLTPDDRVVGITIGDESRAYPIRLLNYHEVVNDQLGRVPIAVVYCPLCDSVSVLDRRIDGQTLSFGVSGLLLHSNVLMYDSIHNALWTQVGCRALSGPLAGRSLSHINSWELATFGAWSDRHPEGRVVTFETGYDRNYLRSPYAQYFENDELYFPVPRDDRLPRQKVPVIGVRLGDLACAVPVEAVERSPDGRLEIPIGDRRVVLASDPGSPGIAIIESPADAQIVHTFWFAWAAFHPGTTLFSGEASTSRAPTVPARAQ